MICANAVGVKQASCCRSLTSSLTGLVRTFYSILVHALFKPDSTCIEWHRRVRLPPSYLDLETPTQDLEGVESWSYFKKRKEIRDKKLTRFCEIVMCIVFSSIENDTAYLQKEATETLLQRYAKMKRPLADRLILQNAWCRAWFQAFPPLVGFSRSSIILNLADWKIHKGLYPFKISSHPRRICFFNLEMSKNSVTV